MREGLEPDDEQRVLHALPGLQSAQRRHWCLHPCQAGVSSVMQGDVGSSLPASPPLFIMPNTVSASAACLRGLVVHFAQGVSYG